MRIIDERRLFHPKVYIFRNGTDAVAWIGSANFTSGGFGGNEELLFETEDAQPIQEWFEDRWEQCDEFRLGAIDDYERRRNQNPNPLPRFPQPEHLAHPYELLETITDWNEYRHALDKCNDWWADGNEFAVFGEESSWYNTISELHDVIRRNLSELDKYNQRRLLGLTGIGSGLLGNMRESNFNTVFGNQHNLEVIQRSIRCILEAQDNEFPDVAIGEYENITTIHGIRQGIATRFMALARPDRIVSLNSASANKLAQYFDLAPTTLGNSQNYLRLLERLYNKTWFNAPEPDDPYDRSIWSMRAALIDCFVYQL